MKMSLGVSPYTDELVRYFLLMAPCVFFFFLTSSSKYLAWLSVDTLSSWCCEVCQYPMP